MAYLFIKFSIRVIDKLCTGTILKVSQKSGLYVLVREMADVLGCLPFSFSYLARSEFSDILFSRGLPEEVQ